jgi:hypothetical protein
MSVPRRERDARRTPAQRDSEEFLLRRLMEEAPGGKVTSSDVAHIARNRAKHAGSSPIIFKSRGSK